jgi:hypothetical protein
MSIVLFFLAPAAFIYYSAGNRFSGLPTYRLAYASGVCAGIVLTICAFLLKGVLIHDSSSVIARFFTFFVSCTVIPFMLGPALLYGVFSASLEDRLPRLVPQVFGILSIYMPFILTTYFDAPDMWAVLLTPVQFLSVCFLLDYIVRRYVGSIRLRPTLDGFAKRLIPLFAVLVVFDCLRVMWYFCFPAWSYTSLALILITGSLFSRLIKYRPVGWA